MQTARAPLASPRPVIARLDAFVRGLLRWYAGAARDLPWRRTRDPYAIWISEVMLQQTQVRTVIPYWTRWMGRFPNPASLARASSATVLKFWEGLGYYSRARNLQAAARILVARFDGRFPSDRDALQALPGIGPYTAGAILSIAFNQPAPIVDGNVVRVLARAFGCGARPRGASGRDWFWNTAAALVGRAARGNSRHHEACSRFNQALMELGATVCLPRRPLCDRCPIARICVARQRGWIDRLPAVPSRATALHRRMAAFVIESDGRYLVRQRPADGVNGLLWEFPSVELSGRETPQAAAAREGLQLAGISPKPDLVIRHSITRHRIRLEVFKARPAAAFRRKAGTGTWRSRPELRRRAFPSAHRRIVRHLIEARRNGSPATTGARVNGTATEPRAG